jgi:D-beta-D-heptose 7-phosphate kinase/D-beta-D-heptose 1-phosphate adenosyltransferase
VFDVTGAGDTVVAVLALCVAADARLDAAAALANVAAGCVVAKMGTATVSPHELQRAALGDGVESGRIIKRGELQSVIKAARDRGEVIVMTDGCFDLLHAGHVEYLEAAKNLGDKLIVAVNDDAAVRRLKGSDRPINPLEARMAVLTGLQSVDWVIEFAEDTPLDLVNLVRPDILVKGGDYQREEIVGYDLVSRSGGKIVVLDWKKGVSTTRLLERIRASGQMEAS